MKNITIIILVAIISQFANTQTQTFDWVKQFDGTTNEVGHAIDVDNFGNVYTVGIFNGTTDFDPGAGVFNLTSAGYDDIFISKIDSDGNFLWAKQIRGTEVEAGYAINVSNSGNIYITGTFRGTADFDPGINTFNLTSTEGYQVFISKLDSSGNFAWAKQLGGSGYDVGNDIVLDTAENIYITGVFMGVADFDPGPGIFNLSSEGMRDVFSAKFDNSGNLIWAKQMGGLENDYGRAIDIDDLGNVYSSGSFRETVDFDPGNDVYSLTSLEGYDSFISKLDSDGNFVWAKHFSGPSNNAQSVAVSDSGNVYTTGTYNLTTDFDPGPNTFNLTAQGNNDIYISKLDSSGNFVWAKQLNGTDYDYVRDIDIDAAENVYVTGSFNGVVDFDPGPVINNFTSEGSRDVFILKLDGSGNFVWARQMGSSYVDHGNSIVLDAFRNIYTTGYFQGTVDFDSGVDTAYLTYGGQYDVFVHKISQCSSTGTDTQSACDSYTWIDGNTYSTNNNTAMFNIINGAANGCDSLVTLDLTINSNTGIDVQNACDSLTWIDGNTYTADNNTVTFTLTNTAGCDSVVTLNLTVSTVDTSVTNYSSLLSANASGANYQWLDCENSYAPISGETSQFFIITANGEYAVEVTQNGCIDTTECITVSNVGIDENTLANSISVYPNPTSGKLNIDLVDANSEMTIKVSNVLGQNIYTSTIEGQEHTELNIEGGKGVYFVELSNARGERSLVKVIKN